MIERVLLVAWKGSPATAWVETLRSGGFHVLLEDTTGERAWRTAKERGIDLVIIDGLKKPSHGRQTGYTLRDTAKTRDIPIIWTNLHADDTALVQSEVHPDMTLPEPTEATDALAALQSLAATFAAREPAPPPRPSFVDLLGEPAEPEPTEGYLPAPRPPVRVVLEPGSGQPVVIEVGQEEAAPGESTAPAVAATKGSPEKKSPAKTAARKPAGKAKKPALRKPAMPKTKASTGSAARASTKKKAAAPKASSKARPPSGSNKASAKPARKAPSKARKPVRAAAKRARR